MHFMKGFLEFFQELLRCSNSDRHETHNPQGMLNFLTIVGMIFLLNPWIVLPTLPLVAVFYLFRQVYLATSRDVKRLEATCEYSSLFFKAMPFDAIETTIKLVS